MNQISRNQIMLFISLGLLAVMILLLSFIRESQSQVKERIGATQPSPVLQVVAASLKSVPSHSNYILPYPGLLPTNPLYPLKMVRDRAQLLLTVNPDKKAILLLFFADKRIAAAHLLVSEGQIDPAVTTAMKGEEYLARAIDMSPRMSVSMKHAWFDRLKQATLKHEEVIEELQKVATGSLNSQAGQLYQNLELYRNRIVSLSGTSFDYIRPEDAVGKIRLPVSASPSAAPVRDPLKPYL